MRRIIRKKGERAKKEERMHDDVGSVIGICHPEGS
jgi:hypothetical protein